MNETRVVPVELSTDVHDAMAAAVQHAIATSNPCAYWTIARAAFDALISAAPAPNPSADGDAHDKCLAKYAELIYAVGNKYPGETRHETALRYIRQAENRDLGPAQQAIDRVQTENL